MKRRCDADYEIAAVSKAIKVFEALEGTTFEPVKVKKLMQRTGFSKDIVERSLKTLKLHGWAMRDDETETWQMGRSILRLSGRYSEICMTALSKR